MKTGAVRTFETLTQQCKKSAATIVVTSQLALDSLSFVLELLLWQQTWMKMDEHLIKSKWKKKFYFQGVTDMVSFVWEAFAVRCFRIKYNIRQTAPRVLSNLPE